MSFYSEGLHFSCCKCSHCCRIEPGFVYISWSDLTKLCQWFKFTELEFIRKFCRWVPYYDGSEVLCLKETPEYDCILWKDGCTAYENRPVQCSTFPFWSWILEDRKSWDDSAKDCPGINCGKLWTWEEIEKQKDAYDENVPIRRTDINLKMSGSAQK